MASMTSVGREEWVRGARIVRIPVRSRLEKSRILSNYDAGFTPKCVRPSHSRVPCYCDAP